MELARQFFERWGRPPERMAYAPGRVEILGNHTDYNQGLALAAAIDRGIGVAVASTPDSRCRLHAVDLQADFTFDLRHPSPQREAPWANYVIGMAAAALPTGTGAAPQGFDAVISGNLPPGAGLSSSAALTMAAGLALDALYGRERSTLDLARTGQTAEHTFAGVRCGLLDQLTSLLARADHLLLIDFRTLDTAHLPLPPAARFLICRTHRPHTLAEAAYNERRAACETAVATFTRELHPGITSLRQLSPERFAQHRHRLDPLIARRAAHPIGEIARVRQACLLLNRGDLPGFGRLLSESHESSRHNFENSSEELDTIVDTAATIPGTLGARLTGGGFGGSVLVLTTATAEADVATRIANAYQAHYDTPCTILPVTASQGAHLLTIETPP